MDGVIYRLVEVSGIAVSAGSISSGILQGLAFFLLLSAVFAGIQQLFSLVLRHYSFWRYGAQIYCLWVFPSLLLVVYAGVSIVSLSVSRIRALRMMMVDKL